MIPPTDDECHDPIPVATSFAYERFNMTPRFAGRHSMQIETPVDAIRAASKSPNLPRIDIDSPPFDALTIIDDLETGAFGHEHLQRCTGVLVQVLSRLRLP